MAHIKTVGIKDLKNNLSAHLRDVRRGARILVGVVVLPTGKKLPLPASPVRIKEGAARHLLDQGRDETRS